MLKILYRFLVIDMKINTGQNGDVIMILPSDPKRKGMKLWKKICLLGISLVFVMVISIVLFYVIENTSGRKAWERYVQWYEAKNQTAASDQEKVYLWIENILPPPVDEEKNFANHPLFKAVFHCAENGSSLREEEDLEEPLKTWAKVLDGYDIWKNWTGKPSSLDFRRMDIRKKHPSADLKELEVFANRIKTKRFNEGEFQTILKELKEQQKIDENALISKKVNALMLLQELESGLAGYEEMRKALKNYPQCCYPFEYEKGLVAIEPHLSLLRSLAFYANLQASADLILKKSSDEAFQDTMFSMDIADTLSSGLLSLISIMVKVQIYANSLNVIWEGIESDYWSLENLKQFQEHLESVDFLKEFRMSFVVDRCLWNATFSTNKGTSLSVINDDNGERVTLSVIVPRGWVYRGMLGYNKKADLVLTLFDMKNECLNMDVFPSVFQDLEEENYGEESNNPIRDAFLLNNFLELTPNYFDIIRSISSTQFLINSAQIACALERYRLENKKYPNSLEELGDLLPKDKVPLDWMEHKAPKYRLTDSGYVLWNNGWNRTDEGGIRGKSTKEGDWVWEIAKDKSVNEEK